MQYLISFPVPHGKAHCIVNAVSFDNANNKAECIRQLLDDKGYTSIDSTLWETIKYNDRFPAYLEDWYTVKVNRKQWRDSHGHLQYQTSPDEWDTDIILNIEKHCGV